MRRDKPWQRPSCPRRVSLKWRPGPVGLVFVTCEASAKLWQNRPLSCSGHTMSQDFTGCHDGSPRFRRPMLATVGGTQLGKSNVPGLRLLFSCGTVTECCYMLLHISLDLVSHTALLFVQLDMI